MRAAGILMPISSLPSPYGIGTIGKAAYNFVDFLAKAKQVYWQILPLGPTGYGDSPYQSFSAFAANPYYIDLDMLIKDKLLTQIEVDAVDFGDDQSGIDYLKLFENRKQLLNLAVNRFNLKSKKFKVFQKENAHWLLDYAIFMALKEKYEHCSYTEWSEDIRTREKTAMEKAKIELKKDIIFWQVAQYFFFSQWRKLKVYANKKGVKIVGDIPIYVSPDSSDLWANPQLFQVDEYKKMTEVAGCPPDAFTADGQLWGNPLYDWDYHSQTDYEWWIGRMSHACSIYDVVRIDHFRGFAGYYAIKADEKTAKHGRWRIGPSSAFIESLKAALPKMEIIAEDLGFLTADVYALLKSSGFPGTKVLQFAFDSREESDYLPHNYPKNCVVYTGTHDNTTTEDWKIKAPKKDVEYCKKYLDIKEGDDFTRKCIRACFGSVADTCIIPMADWLGLGENGRINTPSTVGGNWQWRLSEQALTKKFAKEIGELTKIYGRARQKS